ncbi:hypothetical protein [Oceanispirochaeta sp.]|jgi:hypothetical protein|uniref:hypothetical protein n=1 Tax=Oceanispirochaeta sp. TaxID=2035350 RepID=UPI00260C8389|nr:hypothetical protein [Oceanispirochaeta sp.]MDA3956693.1 hypothetical protein [Oceanispirochaeta sp.]
MKRIIRAVLVSSLTLLLVTCFLYEEKIYDNPFDPKLTGGAYNPPVAAIVLDGSLFDWDSVPTYVYDTTFEGTNSGLPTIPGGDINIIKVAQDDENLYFYLSTENGIPLENPGTQFSINMHDENDNYSVNAINLSHNSDGTMYWWSNYNYRIDADTWDGYPLEDPAFRFPGFDPGVQAIEFGISKTVYWDELGTNEKMNFNLDTWYEPYQISDGDGGLDHINDDDNNYIILIKGAAEATPSEDVPIVQFPRGTPSINGSYDGSFEWEDYGVWYQDFLGDDTGTDNNCDIDKIYMQQDDENIYMLVTFDDPAQFDSSGNLVSYNLNANHSEGTYNYTFHADHDGGSAWVANINGNPTNCFAVSAQDGYLELQFDKTETWDGLPYGAFNFRLEVYDQFSSLVDSVNFMGSYKKSTDTPPTP